MGLGWRIRGEGERRERRRRGKIGGRIAPDKTESDRQSAFPTQSYSTDIMVKGTPFGQEKCVAVSRKPFTLSL